MKFLSVFLLSLVSAAVAFANAPVPADPFYSDAGGYTGDRTLARLFSSSSTGSNPDYGYTKPYSWGGVTLSDAYDCLVMSNKAMYVISDERFFPGTSLQFGVSDNYSKAYTKGSLYLFCHPETKPFEVKGDIIFVNGNLFLR